MYSVITEEITEVEFEFRIETGNDYTTQIFEKKTPIVIFSDRWFKIEGKIDLNNKEEFLNCLNEVIYNVAKTSMLKVGFSEIGDISSVKYKLAKDNRCHLLLEVLYGKDGSPIIFNKH